MPSNALFGKGQKLVKKKRREALRLQSGAQPVQLQPLHTHTYTQSAKKSGKLNKLIRVTEIITLSTVASGAVT